MPSSFHTMKGRRPTPWIVGVVVVFLGLALSFQTSFSPPVSGQRELVLEQIRSKKVIPLNRDLAMTNRSRYLWILGDGFEEAEPDGTWIMALQSTIDFSTKPGRRPTKFQIRMLPLVSRLKPLRTFEFDSSAESRALTVDESMPLLEIELKLDGKPHQQVYVTCDELVSPSFLQIGPDRRPMCAKVISVRVSGD